MLSICWSTRCAVSTPTTMTSRNASAVVPAMSRSFLEKVIVIGVLFDVDDFGRTDVGSLRDVADGAPVLEDVRDHLRIGLQLGRRQPSPGEDALLPIVPHRADRSLEHLFDELLPRR